MVSEDRSGLIEREDALARIVGLIDLARSGSGRLLVIDGDAGIGKTALLRCARTEAATRGMTVLSGRSSELERGFPFGVARQLFEPFLASVSNAERRVLLEGAPSLAARVIGIAADAADRPAPLPLAPSDPSFPVLHGLYWLCANASERAGLLLAVDDAHWADLESVRFLRFLLARLEELPVLVAVTCRPSESGPASELIAEMTSDVWATVIRPAPLSELGVAVLLRRELDPAAARELAGACRSATGGNPFLLRQLILELRRRRPEEVVTADDVPRLVPEAVGRSVALRIRRVGEGAWELARALVVLGDASELRAVSALAGFDRERTAQLADALSRAGILAGDRRLSFAHPILRAAVYAELSPTERATEHERAARLLERRGAAPDEVAAHLLRTGPSGAESTVSILRAAASRALERGAGDAAAAYLRRALTEPPPTEVEPDVLVELGAAELRAGNSQAACNALERAIALRPGGRTLGRAAVDLAWSLVGTGRRDEAFELLERASREAAAVDSELALSLEAERLNWRLFMLEVPTAAELEALRERARLLAARGRRLTSAERLLLAALSHALGWMDLSVTAAEAADIAERALADGRLLREHSGEASPFVFSSHVLLLGERLDVLEPHLVRALQQVRANGSLLGFIAVSALRSQLAFLRGTIAEAEAEARNAERAAQAHAWIREMRFALPFLVDALIERDELDAAEQAIESAGIGEVPDDRSAFDIELLASRGRLRLARGQLEAGVADLLRMEHSKRRRGLSKGGPTSGGVEAAPVLASLGRSEQARRLSKEALAVAQAVGTPRATGAALRSCGLVEGGSAGLALLRQSVSVLERSPVKIDYLRSLVELGTALCRAHETDEARACLEEALELARRSGATRLARRAHEELSATGVRLSPFTLIGPKYLTPSERRIAEMAATGMTNREIAQALFVTVKTVEAHLSRAFRKLDISSRTQLPHVLGHRIASEPTAPPAPVGT